MDITKYDEYIPEKELDMNFRIPRKRTAEESLEHLAYNNVQYPIESTQPYTKARLLSAYSGLSGAASRASAYSNYKGPVTYNHLDISKLDTSVKPPGLQTHQNTSNTGTQYSNAGIKTAKDFTKITPILEKLMNSNRSQNSSQTQSWSKPLEIDFSTENQSQGSNWNRAKGSNWNSDQRQNWNSNQMAKWNPPQELKWNDRQSTESNKKQVSVADKTQFPRCNNSSTKLSDALLWKWKKTHGSKWNDEKELEWKNPDAPTPDIAHAPTWNSPQGGQRWSASDNIPFNRNRVDERENMDIPRPVEAPLGWNRLHNNGGQGLSPGENRFLNRNWDDNRPNMNRPGPVDKPFGWNNSGNNGGNNFNRNFNGRGGIKQRGFRNEGNNQDNFRRGMNVMDNDIYEDSSYNAVPGWKPRTFQNKDGKMNTGKNWNKLEKPKKPKPITPPVVIPDTSDESLPKELRLMFQPLFCKLCSLQMTSNVMAKMHYVSKNHEKKIRKFLIAHSEKTGEPLHPRATVTASQGKKEKEEDKDPKNFYCELCDLQLTGKQHADSHYMGKSHNAVRMGKKRPAGKGLFDATGKWIRKDKEPKLEYGEGEDNFGMDFKQKTEGNEAPSAPVPTKPKTAVRIPEQFTCSLCTVSCISQEQLNIHFSGAKHKKKLKAKGVSLDNFILPEKNKELNEGDVIPTAVDFTAPKDIDESLKNKYMTPNGFFYCEKCNLTVNSEIQFKQHLSSKNHAKKANAFKTQ